MPPTLRCTASITSLCARQLCQAGPSRSFSTSIRNEQRLTRARRQLFRWLGTQGANFLNPLESSTNYLSAYDKDGQLKRVVEAARNKGKEKPAEESSAPRGLAEPEDAGEQTQNSDESKPKIPDATTRDQMPFPLNRAFVSQPVLGGRLKDEIWFRIMVEGKSVRDVSAELGVEMSRVGAVVRLKEVEKEWERIGKPMANAYSRAVNKMLPKTLMNLPGEKVNTHESINDLPVHRATGQQIFHPTSESRQFTRTDAAKVFDEKLLPADDRIPHPELVILHKERLEDVSQEERRERADARVALAEKKRVAAVARAVRKEAAIKKVDTGRWAFHFTEINVDDAGKTGRGHKGVGWRYGAPHMDRSRGMIKIPKSVE